MSDELDPKPDPCEPSVYQIRIKGHLGSEWADWFEGLTITLEDNGETLLTGPVIDQAALHGLLRKVRDLGMPLVSINRVEPGQADTSDIKPKLGKSLKMESEMTSIKKIGRVAGFLYLIIAILGPFSLMYVPSTLVAPGDAATTASNIMASEGLFRLGMAGEAVIFLIEIVLPIMLYVLLKPVNNTVSLAAMSSRLAMAVIQGINLLNNLLVLLLLSGAAYLKAFEPGQLHALVLLFLDAHQYGESIWGAFFGLHLLALGYLVLRSGYILFKSRYIPRILGALLMIGSIGYLMDSFGNFLLPDNEALSIVSSVLLVASVIGELSFFLMLLIKGVNVEQWEKRALESA